MPRQQGAHLRQFRLADFGGEIRRRGGLKIADTDHLMHYSSVSLNNLYSRQNTKRVSGARHRIHLTNYASNQYA
jgi:hypothetical protein